MKRGWMAGAVGMAVVAAWSGVSFGDEVLFKNGDKLTGTIVTADGGKITLKTAVAGEVKIDMKDVRTFSTDQPIELKMADGNVIKDKVKATTEPSAPEGTVQTAGTGTIQSQPVTLADVKKINPPPVKWTGAILAGGLLTRGNTDTDSFNFAADATRRTDDDRTTLAAGYLYGREEVPGASSKTTTVDNWFAQGKYDYFFAPKWYAYGNVRVERDRIADLDLRLTPGAGIGYQWVETPDLKFNTEAGLSWVYEQYSHGGGSDEHFAARFAYHLEKKINDKVGLFHNLEYLPSVEDLGDFNLNADLGIRVTLTKQMFTEFKTEWKHDETPAPGKSTDDMRYILSVGWAF